MIVINKLNTETKTNTSILHVKSHNFDSFVRTDRSNKKMALRLFCVVTKICHVANAQFEG